MTEKTLRRVYWASTLLFLVPQLYNATQMLGGAPQITGVITALGYPLYFVKALAIAKLLGAAAILYDRARALKEWAYAGNTFEVLAAFVSELAAGRSTPIALVVLVFLVLLLVSYGCWKRLLALPDLRATAGYHNHSVNLRSGHDGLTMPIATGSTSAHE